MIAKATTSPIGRTLRCQNLARDAGFLVGTLDLEAAERVDVRAAFLGMAILFVLAFTLVYKAFAYFFKQFAGS
jgi:hypothetical protein